MAWSGMKYRIIEIKTGFGHPFEIESGEFNSIEEAVEELKTHNPLEPQKCIIVPTMSYYPYRD